MIEDISAREAAAMALVRLLDTHDKRLPRAWDFVPHTEQQAARDAVAALTQAAIEP